jgi:hypothetical protein
MIQSTIGGAFTRKNGKEIFSNPMKPEEKH